jgi:hypothetical protein
MEREAGVNTVVLIHGLWMTPLWSEHTESTRAYSTQARQGIGRGGLLCIQGFFGICRHLDRGGRHYCSPRLPH